MIWRTPEAASVALRVTITSPLFQPTAFGAGEGSAVVTDGVVSDGTSVILATKTSPKPPPKVGWKAPAVVGKSLEVAPPVT